MYKNLGLYSNYRITVLPGTESTASLIGHINFDMKTTGERYAGNPHGSRWRGLETEPQGHRASPRPYGFFGKIDRIP